MMAALNSMALALPLAGHMMDGPALRTSLILCSNQSSILFQHILRGRIDSTAKMLS